MKNKIIIISGDPNSINSEILYKCLKKVDINTKKKIYIISNYKLLKEQLKLLGYSLKLKKVKNLYEKSKLNEPKIIDINLKFKDPFNVSFKSSSKFIKDSFDLGHKLALKKDVIGLINCPIDKKLLNFNNKGVTEYLALKCKVKKGSEVMLIKNKYLSVCPVTTHIKLKDVSKHISSRLIYKKIETIQKWYKSTKNKNPNIGVTGLNPHNSELKKGSEECTMIIPAIKKSLKKGFKVSGPLVADTLFINDYKRFDVIIGMYHDQILTPFKTIYKFDAINLTLGLKYLRLSPDHGVGKNLIKKKIANHISLLECIKFLKNKSEKIL